MSNWAAYKEKEIGLPVVKRAKHGIHFDAGKGLVQAEFVGKPCHYFDGKEYKAIDTRPLLRKDGTFGCAHSDVIIHTDGTVQVGDYTQRAALIYPGKISVDGDRIARPFSGGVQYLYITEDGYRQEIVLDKMPDLTKVSALVDSVKGILPTKYTASSLSLKDSSTAELSDFVQVDSKSLASVLETARYPVVIDPDLNLQPDPTDGLDTFIYQGAATTNYATDARLIIDMYNSSNQNGRGLLKFDVSSIPSGATVSVGSLSLYLNTGQTEDARTLKAHRITANWVEAQVTWNIYSTGNNWSTAGGDYVATETASTSVSTYGAWYAWNILADVQAWVAGTASNYGDIIIGQETEIAKRKIFHSSDYTTDTSLRPKLAVTYTAGGSIIPIVQYYNRLRRN